MKHSFSLICHQNFFLFHYSDTFQHLAAALSFADLLRGFLRTSSSDGRTTCLASGAQGLAITFSISEAEYVDKELRCFDTPDPIVAGVLSMSTPGDKTLFIYLLTTRYLLLYNKNTFVNLSVNKLVYFSLYLSSITQID